MLKDVSKNFNRANSQSCNSKDANTRTLMKSYYRKDANMLISGF